AAALAAARDVVVRSPTKVPRVELYARGSEASWFTRWVTGMSLCRQASDGWRYELGHVQPGTHLLVAWQSQVEEHDTAPEQSRVHRLVTIEGGADPLELAIE